MANSQGLVATVKQFAGTLRFPSLFALTAGLFVVDLLVPDIVPFADEILLALLTLVLANVKKKWLPGVVDGAGAPAKLAEPKPSQDSAAGK